MALAAEAYRLAKLMPKPEEYRLTSQLLRAAASVPANIAEGHARGTRKDYANFISIARGSLAETETFLMLVARAGLLPDAQTTSALSLADEVSRMLYALRKQLASDPSSLKPDPSPLNPEPST